MNKSILRILKLAQKGKEGHVPSSLSILDIIETLYKKFINKKEFGNFKFTDIKKGLNKTIEWHNEIIKK